MAVTASPSKASRTPAAPVDVVPLQTVRVALVITPGAPFGIERTTAAEPGEWAGDFGARVYPEGFSLALGACLRASPAP